ncbi:MAG TPA: heme-binding protein [Stellaceae bacterium]|nr:heme-binding protein [Stellaceae bacterium]
MIRPSPLLMLALVAAAPAWAADVLTTHRLSAALANEAVGAAVASCAKQGYAETVVVVDSDGVRQAVLRGDGAGIHTLDSANDKAYTSLTFKADTGALVQLAPQIGTLTSRLPHLLLFQGGLVIKLDTEVIGAIGASGAPGGPLDEACARAGIDAIKDRVK